MELSIVQESKEVKRARAIDDIAMTRYEDVKDITTEEYFHNNAFSIDAFKMKYAVDEHETYVKALKRVCDYVSSCEATEELRKYWSARWFDEMYNDWWSAAGSIMQGAASTRKISLMNCTTLPLKEDTIESIFDTAKNVAKCAAYRQGLGVDFSALRPRGAAVNNSSNVSNGAIHWMEFIDSIGYKVGQKGRIPAMLFSLRDNSLDIEEFINVKSDRTRIQNANISVQITDAFYEAYENDKDWELSFTINDSKKISKTIKARDLLEQLAKNMHAHAEPGVQNIDVARKYSNSDTVDFKILSTNACSEEFLDSSGNCDLASINCSQFSTNKEKRSKELEKIGTSICRFLDNVVEMEIRDERYPTDDHCKSLKGIRRIGAGITNICGYLFKNNLSYGTPDGNKSIEEFVEEYRYNLYKASIALGKEKGSFKAFDRSKFETALNVQKMMKKGLEFSHMRNVETSAIAPTGSLSLMFRQPVLSYGIEPAFGLYYWKRTRISGKYEYYFVVPGAINDYMKSIDVPVGMECGTIKDDWKGTKGSEIAAKIDKHCKNLNFKTATQISALDKLDLMSRVAKHIDNSISVTYLLSEDATWETVRDFILEAHKKEVKSVAAFPDKKMYGIVSLEPFYDLAVRLSKEKVAIHKSNFTSEEFLELKKIVQLAEDESDRPTEIVYKNAPKRPDELECDIHQFKVKGNDWIIIIGLLNSSPYEIFGGNSEIIEIAQSIKKGKLVKRQITGKINRYDLVCGSNGETVTFKNILKAFNNKDYGSFTRLLSLSLRHGAPVQYIVEQLQKDESETLDSFTKVMSRVLKSYIKDGTKASNEKSCPACKSNELVYAAGCITCAGCNWSRCQ